MKPVMCARCILKCAKRKVCELGRQQECAEKGTHEKGKRLDAETSPADMHTALQGVLLAKGETRCTRPDCTEEYFHVP